MAIRTDVRPNSVKGRMVWFYDRSSGTLIRRTGMVLGGDIDEFIIEEDFIKPSIYVVRRKDIIQFLGKRKYASNFGV